MVEELKFEQDDEKVVDCLEGEQAVWQEIVLEQLQLVSAGGIRLTFNLFSFKAGVSILRRPLQKDSKATRFEL